MSVTSYPFRLGPTKTTGRIDGTTSYGDEVSCFLKKGFRFSLVGGVANGVLPCRDAPIESLSSPGVGGVLPRDGSTPEAAAPPKFPLDEALDAYNFEDRTADA